MVRDGICGESVNGLKMVVGISYSFYIIFSLFLAPIPNFTKTGRKTQKLRNLAIDQFWLLGLVSQKMFVGASYLFPVIFGPLIATIPNCIQIGQKKQN